MISTRLVSAIAAAAMASMAVADGTPTTSSSSSILSLTTPTASVAANTMTDMGCFNTTTPLEDHGYYLYQSPGNCQLVCLLLQKPVMGLSDGTNCWCGDLVPEADSSVDNKTCDTDCSGTDKYKCGGPKLVYVSLTGLTKNRISNFSPSPSASSTASSTKAPAAQTTQQGETILVTATDSPAPKQAANGPNKAGIAAGVVVGVLVLIAIIVGVVLFLRHKRRKDAEEDYRRRSAANPFFTGKPHTSNSSMTDSRLDPEFMHRRASNGSIADNEDYSRRILKVTNA